MEQIEDDRGEYSAVADVALALRSDLPPARPAR